MSQQASCLRSRFHSILPLFSWALTACVFVLTVTFPANAQKSQTEGRTGITFEARLEFYLDKKSRDFLTEMAAQEQALLQLIRNVSKEIRQRGPRAIARDEAGFRELYRESEGLISEYTSELNQVLALIEEIDRLKETVSREKNQRALEQVGDLKDRLVSLLEDRDLYRKAPYTSARLSTMLSEYEAEIDSLVSIYQRLERFERLAEIKGDEEILSEINAQKQRIAYILSQWQVEPTVDDQLATEYLAEAERLVDVLRQLEQLGSRALQRGDEVSAEIEALRREILASLDARLLRLFGYDAPQRTTGPTVSELFAEWKAERIAAFEAKRTEYEIIRNRLLESGTEEERARMLQREIADAMLNYADGNYQASEVQFSSILRAYKPYFPNLDAVVFYRSETYYARKMYELARPGYVEIINNYPDSDYTGEAYFRLLNITHVLGEKDAFSRYYHAMMANRQAYSPSLLTHANYLSGFHFLQEDSLALASEALASVGKESKYYYPAQYLLAITHLRNDEYDDAREILLMLADKKSYPWSDKNTTLLRNNALLKLGFIAYEQGDYEEALKYFNAVSKGYTAFDQSLLGIAWTNLKRGKYDSTVVAIGEMLQDYLASDYTYEALVLAAHSKRLLDRGDEALKDLRYVATSRRMLDVTKEYNEERRYILSLLDDVERMEETVLDRRDRQLFELVNTIRDQVMATLSTFSYRGIVGRRLFEDYENERRAVLKQIEELDRLIETAKQYRMETVLRDAEARRDRLVKTLDTYQVDESVKNVNYFVDYPLATREAVSQYRKGIYETIVRDLLAEQTRLQKVLQETRALLEQGSGVGSMQARLDLEILEKDLSLLQKRLDRFRSWVNEHPVEEPETQFDVWADFSGYGLSDITFDRIQKDDQRITYYAENINFINLLLLERQKTLEQRLAEYDAEMRRIEQEMERQKIELERQRREEYFRQSYFDLSDQEPQGEVQEESTPPSEEPEPPPE
jgi:TolA-binding protein